MDNRFGTFLASLRQRKNLSLRDVERDTGVSNAYISQLENGKIKAPSPVVLNKLAELYSVKYAVLMKEAGYPVPAAREETGVDARFASRIGPVTPEEEEDLAEYLAFLRSRKRAG
jgi:transcriptional regulator with XRE-family HTH domain